MRPPQDWRTARFTLGIAAVTAAAWLIAVLLRLEAEAAVTGGFIPARVGGVPGDDLPLPLFVTPLTATLVHAGFIHIAFNLLILLFCGRAVEPIIGSRGLIVLYLVGAYAAAAGHWAVSPGSISPMVGASGSVSALLGTYALLFGRNKVKASTPRMGALLHALWLGAAWVIFQLLIGYASATPGPSTGSSIERVAYGAHIGGFLAGLLLAKPLLLLRWRGA